MFGYAAEREHLGVTFNPLPPGAKASLHFGADQPIVLADIRAWAKSLAPSAADLELLLTELVSNARDHGRRGAIAVAVERNEETVIVTVSNETKDKADPVHIDRAVSPVSDPRGRGLRIVSALSYNVAIEQSAGKITVRAQLAV